MKHGEKRAYRNAKNYREKIHDFLQFAKILYKVESNITFDDKKER